MDAIVRPDDNTPVVGLRAWAETATAEGFPIAHSSMQKHNAAGTGPQVEGYWGVLPTTTVGNIRAWIKSRISTSPPHSRRWQRQTPTSTPASLSTP